MNMEPHGQSPWYLHEIPSYAPGRLSGKVCTRQGFGGLSAGGEIRRSSDTRFRIGTDTAHAFIHGQSPWFSA